MISKREKLAFKDDGVYRTQYEYVNGLLVRSVTINPSGFVSEEELIEYYANNKEKSRIKCKDGKLESQGYHKYDSRDRLIETYNSWKGYSGSNYSFTHKYTWIDGSSQYGRMETRIDQDDNSKKEYHYDYEDRLKKTVEYDKDGIVTESIEYIFDLQGREYKRILDNYYGEEEKYDQHGNTIWMKWYPNFYKGISSSNKYKQAITTMEYRYDVYGNWVEFRQFRDGVYNMLHTRKIEYI